MTVNRREREGIVVWNVVELVNGYQLCVAALIEVVVFTLSLPPTRCLRKIG